MVTIICENCGNKHRGDYGSGRFCSSYCAKSFSTKAKRSSINEKVSRKLKGQKPTGKPFTSGHNANRHLLTEKDRTKAQKALSIKRKEMYNKLPFVKLPPSEKRKQIMSEQQGCCSHCSVHNWNNKPLVLELHHIDGDTENNNRDNLELLCPNCHSQTSNFRRKKSSLY